MAFLSLDGSELLVVVAYDGPPESGKTTNVRALHQHLFQARPGSLDSPGTTGRRTEFFDWRSFDAGPRDGVPTRVIVLGTPGQRELFRRRELLLTLADAVVFVVDSATRHWGEAARMARELSAVCDVRRRVVLQANKQDSAGSLLAARVVRALELPPEIPAIEASAATYQGVASTFLAASRLAMANADLERRDARGLRRLELTTAEQLRALMLS